MLTKLKLALAIAAPLAAGATTYAVAGGQDHKAQMIQKFDQNGDGQLDDNERAQMKAAFEQKRAERLAKYDANKDGQLDDNERLAMRNDRAATRFQKLDTNGDGQLSLAEYQAGAKRGHHHGRRFHGGMLGAPGAGGSSVE